LDIPVGKDLEHSHFYEEVFLEISHASRCCTSFVKNKKELKSVQISIKKSYFQIESCKDDRLINILPI
jgi:hypothetical protein